MADTAEAEKTDGAGFAQLVTESTHGGLGCCVKLCQKRGRDPAGSPFRES